ncbi:DUF6517 family protein [Haloarchaeobius sp. DFWS5]|uniref:DUF6517 family protein n=1 Tax=Haloarchaeobius sp. DFWS5 TaxID=3446114 RepID=UPI003EB8B396
MHARRKLVAVVAVTVLLTSGCLGFVTGDEALEYGANQAVVADSALGPDGTGYTETAVENRTTIVDGEEAGIGNRTIKVHNQVAQYEKNDDFIDEKVGIFAVVSTHQTDVVGQPMNPVKDMNNSAVLNQVLGQYETSYGEVTDIQRDGETDVTMLEKATTVGVYTGQTMQDGEPTEVKIYVTMVKHGEDFVIAIGGHPTKLPNEEADVLTMMENVQHSTDDEE